MHACPLPILKVCTSCQTNNNIISFISLTLHLHIIYDSYCGVPVDRSLYREVWNYTASVLLTYNM